MSKGDMKKEFEPQTFTAKILYKGTPRYKDEVILINKYIEDIANSFLGAGVVIGHIDDELQENDPRVVGRVTRIFWNTEGFTTSKGVFVKPDGDWYCDFTLFNQVAISCWESIGFVSTAYTVLESEPGGTWQNNPYSAEIKKVKAEHLAIVSNPRYEEAKILKNSTEDMTIKNEKMESDLTSGALVGLLNKALDLVGLRLENGKAKNDASYDDDKSTDDEKKENSTDEEIMINGVMWKKNEVEEAIKAYANAKKNEADKEDKKENTADEDEDEDDKKENASEEEDKEDKKENASDSEENKKENTSDEEDKKENAKMKKNSSDTPLGDARNKIAAETKSDPYVSSSSLSRQMFGR